MRCDQCKWSKVRTQIGPDKTIHSDLICMFHVPQVQLIPGPQGGIGQISYRPKVENDDFCSEFKQKETHERAAEAKHSSGAKPVDKDGGNIILAE